MDSISKQKYTNNGIDMSNDIITRLRCSYAKDGWPCEQCTFCAARAEIDRLRADGDALAMAYRTLGGLDVAHDAALRAWEEARRG